MKIIIIGATGTLGKIVTHSLREHEIITVGRNIGDLIADISIASSIENLYKKISNIDAVICLAGDSITAPLPEMNEKKYLAGIEQKLLPQINLVLSGMHFLNDNGSFTLISGKMGEVPTKGSSGKALINGALHSFVTAAAQELPRGIRLNIVSPSKVSDIADEDLEKAYRKCIETSINGEIVRVGYTI